MDISNKHKKVYIGVLILAFVLVFFWYAFVYYYGPQINDAYATEQQNRLASIQFPENIQVIDSANTVGKIMQDKTFVMRVSIGVKTDYTRDELASLVFFMTEFEHGMILPYSLEAAQKYHFTGIQKEVDEIQLEKYYLIVLLLKPKTNLDKRNF